MRLTVRRVFCGVFFVVTSLLFLEELSSGTVFISVMNVYTEEFTLPITVSRNGIHADVAVVVIVKGTNQQDQYLLAQSSLRCYCELHDYPLYVLDITKEPSLTVGCPHKDLMFLRHCVLANAIPNWKHLWFLFLDGDMGVINPNHLIEKFLPTDPAISVVFYQRIFNQEIMAGSYIIRNDGFSLDFLYSWANYEFHVPNSFHGTDNGALHSAVADMSSEENHRHRELCSRYWNASRDFGSLTLHEVCLQLYLQKYPPRNISLFRKGRLSWARDGWLTNSVWSPKDFIFHGWQARRQDKLIFGRWHSPLVNSSFTQGDCSNVTEAGKNWRYKNTFFSSDVAVDRLIVTRVDDAEAQFFKLKAIIEEDLH